MEQPLDLDAMGRAFQRLKGESMKGSRADMTGDYGLALLAKYRQLEAAALAVLTCEHGEVRAEMEALAALMEPLTEPCKAVGASTWGPVPCDLPRDHDGKHHHQHYVDDVWVGEFGWSTPFEMAAPPIGGEGEETRA